MLRKLASYPGQNGLARALREFGRIERRPFLTTPPVTRPGSCRAAGLQVATPLMGTSLVTSRLADILFVHALRAYVAMHGDNGAGWIGALKDRWVGTALNLMHGDVSRDWKVDELASAVGMFRSGFALRFKELVGIPPLAYLLNWRMQLARAALRQNEGTIGSLATRFGYASESAFGNAFRGVSSGGRVVRRAAFHTISNNGP